MVPGTRFDESTVYSMKQAHGFVVLCGFHECLWIHRVNLPTLFTFHLQVLDSQLQGTKWEHSHDKTQEIAIVCTFLGLSCIFGLRDCWTCPMSLFRYIVNRVEHFVNFQMNQHHNTTHYVLFCYCVMLCFQWVNNNRVVYPPSADTLHIQILDTIKL